MIEKRNKIYIILSYVVFVGILITTIVIYFLGSSHIKKMINGLSADLILKNELLYNFKKDMMDIQDKIDRHIEVITIAEKNLLEEEISEITEVNYRRLQIINKYLTDSIEEKLTNQLNRNRLIAIETRPELYRLSKLNKDSVLNYNRLNQKIAYKNFLTAYDRLMDYLINATREKSMKIQNSINSFQLVTLILILFTLVVLSVLGWQIYKTHNRLIFQNKVITQNEIRLKNFIDALPDASLAVNSSGEIILLNNEATKLFGYTKDELLNKEIEILIPKRSKVKYSKLHNDYYNSPLKRLLESYPRNLFAVKKDGSEFACDLALNSLETEEGFIFLSTVRDITDKKKIEQALKDSESRLKYAQKIAKIGNWEHNLINNNVIWSDETYRILELDKNELADFYDLYRKLIHPDDRDELDRLYTESIKNKTFYAHKYRLLFDDGRIKYVEEQCETYYDENGNPMKSFGTIQDISIRMEAEKKIEETEARYFNLFENMMDGFYRSSSLGKFIDVNLAMVIMFGYDSKEDLMAVNIKKDLYHSIADWSAARRQGENGNMAVIKLKKKDGTEIWVEDRSRYIWDEKHQLLYYEGILRDVTGKVKAELERAKIAKDLIHRNKDLEQFTYIVSHNLRAPVANIIGLTSILKNTGLTDDFTTEVVNNLFLTGQKLDEIIKDLNKILQIRNQVIEKKERVVLSDIVASIEMSIYSIIQKNLAVIKTDFTAIDEIISIKSYIHSIFYNLILNSIKYRKEGITPVIEIRTELNENSQVIRFKDNGIGFNMKQNKDNIFGLYKRFNPEIEGKGVGLYMVKMQVETLGGQIFLTSELGQGSEFIIKFESPIN